MPGYHIVRSYILAKHNLQFIGRTTLREWLVAMPEFEVSPPLYRAYTLAMMIAVNYLGLSWVEKNIMNSRGRGDHLRQKDLDKISGEESDIHFYRVIEFGEGLLNLQTTEGFLHYIQSLSARNDIEGIMAEIETAKLLKLFNVLFRFNKPTGIKKADYDFEVFAPNGQWICAETKCKLEATAPSYEAVAATLKQIISQVPDDRPSFGFLRIPETWSDQEAVKKIVDRALSRVQTH